MGSTRDADVLEAYRQTCWTIETPGGPLVVRTGEAVPPRAIPLPAAVITAYNPRSELKGPDENRRAGFALADELRLGCLEYLPALAHGGGQAREWDEPGFCIVGVARETAVALGERYGQNAILWIGRGGLPSLVSTRAGFAGSEAGSTL